MTQSKQVGPDEWGLLTQTVKDPDGRGTTYPGRVNLGFLPWLRPYCVDIQTFTNSSDLTTTGDDALDYDAAIWMVC